MDFPQKVLEAKAAGAVRRAIQKVRVATPETFEALQAELFEIMEQMQESAGSLGDKLQEEIERGLGLARKHVGAIQERRAKEDELHARPKALMGEMRDLMVAMQDKLAGLKAQAGLDGGNGAAAELTPEDAEGVNKLADETSAEIKEFAQACVSRATEFKETPMPPEMRKTWTELAAKIVDVKRQAEAAVNGAKAAAAKATEGIRKQRFEELKVVMRERLKECTASVPVAEELVAAAEKSLEPFIKGKPQEEEMLGLAEEVEAAVLAARTAVADAQQELKPVEAEDGEGVDELLKRDLQLFANTEFKRPQMRLGQLGRRLDRVANIVRRCKQDASLVKQKAMVNELKAELLERVKEAASSNAAELAEPTVKEAEKAVESCGKHKTMSTDDMVALDEQAGPAVDAAKAALEDLKQELCPIDPDLDEDVKKQLRALAAPHMKKHAVRLGQLERRVLRATNLLASFRAELAKRRASEKAQGSTEAEWEALVQKPGARVEVIKASVLTEEVVMGSKGVRQLKVGESLEPLEGPVREGTAGVMRIRVKALKDGKEGWATIAGNAGTVFLKDGGA